jgi:hypothetical protein
VIFLLVMLDYSIRVILILSISPEFYGCARETSSMVLEPRSWFQFSPGRAFSFIACNNFNLPYNLLSTHMI